MPRRRSKRLVSANCEHKDDDLVAVGISVARYPPQRSPRAALPHEALILDEWRLISDTRSSRQGEATVVQGRKQIVDADQADMARGRMREKVVRLRHALTGHLTAHHRLLLRELLDQVDFLDGKIRRFESEIRERTQLDGRQ
jgi:hypothetical protein